MPNPASQAKPLLVADGWRKCAGNYYTRPLAPGVLGLLALSPDRGLPHQWRLKPYVGVVHQRVNAVARALTGAVGKSPYPQDTIRHKLVRLLDGPEAQERDRWLIAASLDDNEHVFRAVTDATHEVGLPWMEKRTSLDAVVYELREGNGPWVRTPLLTTALWMKGEVTAVDEWLDEITSKFGAPPPELPEPLRGLTFTRIGSSAPPEGWPRDQFDAFARRLRTAMAQHPEGPPEGWLPRPD